MKRQSRTFTSVQMVHTHAPQQRGFFGRCTSVSEACVFTKNQNIPRSARAAEPDEYMCCRQRDRPGSLGLQRGFEPKYWK